MWKKLPFSFLNLIFVLSKAFSALALAFVNPQDFYVAQFGRPLKIGWEGDGTPVKIQLIDGLSDDLNAVATIANSAVSSPIQWTPNLAGLYGFSITQSGVTAYSDLFTIGQEEAPPPPKGSAPKSSSTPKSSAPKSTAPKSTAPKSTAPKSTAPKSTAPKSTAPKSTAPKSTAPKSTAPKSSARVGAGPSATTTKKSISSQVLNPIAGTPDVHLPQVDLPTVDLPNNGIVSTTSIIITLTSTTTSTTTTDPITQPSPTSTDLFTNPDLNPNSDVGNGTSPENGITVEIATAVACTCTPNSPKATGGATSERAKWASFRIPLLAGAGAGVGIIFGGG